MAARLTPQAERGHHMARDPKPVEPKVGAYDKPQGRGSGPIITAVVVIAAILLVLWLFTDVL
jgi:hypothetical protein